LENIIKTSRLAIGMFGAVALAVFCGAACADGFPEKIGYLIDSRGNVVKSSYGECWRTGYWTPAMAIAECDPDLVKKGKPKVDSLVSGETKSFVVQEKPSAAAVEAYFSAETLFDFDKVSIEPGALKMLDEKIVSSMKMHPEVVLLIITGHTDRIGSEKYNQNLSERRANAVKAYLAKQGVATERMRASGKGESEQNSEANTKEACKGMKDQKLIACLQPDRRVTVESQRRIPSK
jgi:OOP family OmpA-OmpF porin